VFFVVYLVMEYYCWVVCLFVCVDGYCFVECVD